MSQVGYTKNLHGLHLPSSSLCQYVAHSTPTVFVTLSIRCPFYTYRLRHSVNTLPILQPFHTWLVRPLNGTAQYDGTSYLLGNCLWCLAGCNAKLIMACMHVGLDRNPEDECSPALRHVIRGGYIFHACILDVLRPLNLPKGADQMIRRRGTMAFFGIEKIV